MNTKRTNRTTTKPKRKARTLKATTFSDLVNVANQLASKLHPSLVANIDLRDRLGCESLGNELGLTAAETRDLLLADWAATGDHKMMIQMYTRGEKEIAAQFSRAGMSAADVERTFTEAFPGIFSVKALTRTR
jgi:hypothetical protein